MGFPWMSLLEGWMAIESGLVEVYFVKSANVSYTLLDWILHRITEVVATEPWEIQAGKTTKPKPPGSNPILSYCCLRLNQACAFKFRPIGYFLWRTSHFFASGVSIFTSQLGSKSPDLGASKFHQRHVVHVPNLCVDSPGLRHQVKHIAILTPPFFVGTGKGMALWATASTKEITVCRSVLGGTSQSVSS